MTPEASATASCIYEGWVRHRRRTPKRNAFRYGLFLVYLDLDELDRLGDDLFAHPLWSAGARSKPWALARYRRSDYLGDPDVPLKQAVLDVVEQQCGRRPEGAVRMLTHLRYFGYVFNPVTFYYCFEPVDDEGTEALAAVVAEIHNTPWGERFRYVLRPPTPLRASSKAFEYRHDKAFHVSPFMDMDQDYRWRITAPGDSLVVNIENTRFDAAERHFDATLSLRRRPLDRRVLSGVLLRHPLITAKVMLAIYIQAARLWLKRVPFYPHPDKRAAKRTAPVVSREAVHREPTSLVEPEETTS